MDSTEQRTAFRWMYPTASQPILQRSLLITEESVIPPKHYAVFDEIFPLKNKKPENNLKIQPKKIEDDSFHRAIGPVLTIGQCFGVMPVCGLLSPDFTGLRFTWTCWRVAYTLFVMSTSVMMCGCCLFHMLLSDSGYIYKIRSLIFYGSTLTSLILFLKLATRWPEICRSIARKSSTGIALYSSSKYTLRFRFGICCFVDLSLALVEHLLSIVSGVAVVLDCSNGLSPAEAYFMNSFSEFFYFFKYDIWKSACLQIINLASTFNWNFMDLFVIVVSLGLTDRFEQMNSRLDTVIGKVCPGYEHLPEQFWKIMREEYTKLSHLVKEVDGAINEIVLLSFANNLFFICLQLFNTLNSNGHSFDDSGSQCGRSKDGPLWGLSQSIYFSFSFAFLMARSLSVSLGAASLHSASTRPAATLYNVPSTSYCSEVSLVVKASPRVQRFLEQVTTDTIALTGLNFFYVTRGLILTIAGTVVTYELVLVQFNSPPPALTANITINDTCGIPVKA